MFACCRRVAEARVEDPARQHATSHEAQQAGHAHEGRSALQALAVPDAHGLRAAVHHHERVSLI